MSETASPDATDPHVLEIQAMEREHPSLAYHRRLSDDDPHVATWYEDDGPHVEKRDTARELALYLRARLGRP